MPPRLSPVTQQLVEFLFEPGDQAEASRRLMEECGDNLPFCEGKDEYELERIRFAALRLSLGYLDDLAESVGSAKRDWRDVLVWAGFGNSATAHDDWAKRTLRGNARPMVIIVMGVTGAGKTTVGTLLARTLGWMYYEADNFLSTPDFNRIIRGEPLTPEAVELWIGKLRQRMSKYLAKRQNAVFACSALKESYRQALSVSQDVRFVYLRGEYKQIEERQRGRKSSLPHLERLAYEYKVFEAPQDVLVEDIDQRPQDIVDSIRAQWQI